MTEQIVQLPSGLTVAVESMAHTRTVSIGAFVNVGSRDDPAELAGLGHFLEHLLFKGTTSRSAIEISQSIDRVGGDINAYTAKEYTAYYCRIPARHAAVGIDLLGDLLTAPALRDADVDSERHVILDEMAMDDESPDDVVHQAFAKAMFPDHPLGWETAGERATVEAITGDTLREWFDERYKTENTVVSIAGAIDADEVIDRITKAFDRLPVGDGRLARGPAGTMGADLALTDDTEQTHLLVGGRSLARGDADREALDVVNHVLGGGLSSRLFDEIRERRGLAYSVFSSAISYADSGAWSIYAGSMPEHADEVASIVRSELVRLADAGITADELDIAKGYLTGSYEMGLEDSGARMSRLGAQLTLLGHVNDIEAQLARWSAVTLDDATRVIGRVFAEPPITVSLGPAVG
ncbi:MAG TPA: pitrilysin family protein [Ilumatobacter sp.]|nr:pitrilysin family protein [Ilumatobacter sp.]